MVHPQKAHLPILTLCSHSLPCPTLLFTSVHLRILEDSWVGVPQKVSFCDIHPGGGRYQAYLLLRLSGVFILWMDTGCPPLLLLLLLWMCMHDPMSSHCFSGCSRIGLWAPCPPYPFSCWP